MITEETKAAFVEDLEAIQKKHNVVLGSVLQLVGQPEAPKEEEKPAKEEK